VSIGNPGLPGHAGDAVLEVERRLLDEAYGRLALNMLMTAVSVSIFTVPMFLLFPQLAIGAWVAALVLNVVAGLAVRVWFRRSARELRRGRLLFVTHSTLSGASWAVGPTLLAVDGIGAHWALLVSILLVVCAVAMSTQAAQRAGMQAFLSAALVPPTVAAWSTGGEMERLCALVFVVGLVCLVLVGRKSSQALRDLFATEVRLRNAIADAGAAREHAEAASVAKTRFLANMSHELRTPLNAVIGGAQLLRAEQADPERQAYLVDAIQRSGTHLLGLIENILDLSRIEAGEMPLHQVDFQLVECLESAVASAAVPAQAKGLRLVCVAAPSLPSWCRGDQARLRQIVLNLVGNAVKFTAAGEIVVDVQPGAAAGLVRFEVKDTGLGISPEAQAYIFEPFRQADDSAGRRFGGSGLGLAIVRQLVEAMGGRIHVSSEPGTGSTFRFDLPLPEVPPPQPAPAPLGLRVAFFEPHEASARALDATLARLGCEPYRCTGPGALEAWLQAGDDSRSWLLVATDTSAATVFLDRARALLGSDRVIGMSSDVDGAVEHERTGVWVARRIIKPVTRAVLAGGLTGNAGTDARPVAPARVVDATAPIRILVVEDDPINRNIVCRLLAHAGWETVAAADGGEALATFEAGRFDLVLMDWQMPDMDGLEVTRRLRTGAAGPAGAMVPIVALTASAFAEDRAACLAAGMNDFLTKPVLADRLTAAVERWTVRDLGPGTVAHQARSAESLSLEQPVRA